MYMKLNSVDSAAYLFDEIPYPDLSVLNVMISGFSQNGLSLEAFEVFKLFSVPDCKVDEFTIAGVVSKCGNVVNGKQVHCQAVKFGLESNIYAATSLMTMYMRCRELGSATRLFGLIEKRNVVNYNAYFSGVVQNGIEVVDVVYYVFKEMRASLCVMPNAVTMISVLSACVSSKSLRFGTQIHALIMKLMLQFDTNVGTSLVDMYSKCGSWQCAYSVFRELGSNRNLFTWNAMIAGMILNDQCETAIELFFQLETHGLKADSVTWNSMISGFSQLMKTDKSFLFFRKMQASGIVPNIRCITCLLASSSDQSMLQTGKQLHAYARRMEMIDDEFVAATIVDMYMNCGVPSYAQMFFSHSLMNSEDAAVWNTMISGYGRNGKSEDAFDIFNQMVEQNVKPTLATFSCLLSVCKSSGQVDKAFQVFRLMTVDYGLYPTSHHIHTMVTLLSKSGKLDEACELLQSTNEASVSVFASLLGACRNYSDWNLKDTAERFANFDTEYPIPFVILSNIYAGQEKWKDVHKIRKLVGKKGIWKIPCR